MKTYRVLDRPKFSGGLVALIGLVLAAIAANHLRTEAHELSILILGGVVPVILALGTVVGGLFLTRTAIEIRYQMRILGWWLFAMVVAALAGTTIIVYEQSHAVELVDTLYIVTNTVTAGSSGGLLIGYFDARRQQHTDELQTQREQLEILNRVVRHDIQNDMNVIIGWLDILEPSVTDGGRDAFERVRKTSTHVVELTQTARQYVSIIVDDADPDPEPIPLAPILHDEIASRRDAYPDASVHAGEIPAVRVYATDIISSAFRNILNNAVRHNDTHHPEVTITCHTTDDTVTIEIADNGPGIPDPQKERVFGKNERGLDSPGTGIGLYLVRTIITEFDGTVHVEDNDPRGARFVIELPLITDEQPA